MAEGFARDLAGERFEIASAGIEPSSVNPRAILAMREVGIDISAHTSKPLDPGLLSRAEVVVTLCGDANDRCPAVPTARMRLHWDLPDPARAVGTEAEQMAVFRAVRDDIRRRVSGLVAHHPAGG
jgi:arsenate reductase